MHVHFEPSPLSNVWLPSRARTVGNALAIVSSMLRRRINSPSMTTPSSCWANGFCLSTSARRACCRAWFEVLALASDAGRSHLMMTTEPQSSAAAHAR